jgi:anaerobic magnesium-protoporphyrin IX monomethyl ester cyclase
MLASFRKLEIIRFEPVTDTQAIIIVMARVIFIQDFAHEYFGVMYLSSYLKAHGHDCDVIVEYAEKNWIKAVEDFKPDILAFSVLSGSYKWAVEKAKFLKKRLNMPVVFGGVHVFLNPAKTIQESCIDAICTGEGEIPFKELCDSVDRGAMDTSIHGFWFRLSDGSIQKNAGSKLVEDLDSLPFPDRNIYWKYPKIKQRPTVPLLGSRGCPYTCSYCFIPAAKKIFEGQGKFIRERSPENILKELNLCVEAAPNKEMAHFVDDHFGNNRALYLDVLRGVSKLKNGKLKWCGAIRIERFNKEEYVQELAKTNLGLLGIAVECGDENYRKEVLKRDVKNQEIVDAAALATKYGIKFTTLNMVGLPGETFEQVLQTIDLNILIKPVYAASVVYQPYPGTVLHEYAVDHHLLDANVSDSLGISYFDRYLKNDLEFNRIVNLQRVFGTIVTFPWLKKPLVALARGNWRVACDFIFSIYYMWFLLHFYRVNLWQVFNFVSVWARSKFAAGSQPAMESIREGEGQLYPNLHKEIA